MNGRLEALVTIASQSVTADIGGGPVVVSLTDGTYYPTDLLAHVELRLETVLGVGFTITKDWGENGAGPWTLARDSGTYKLLFASLAQANLFGVATAAAWNAAPAASFTSSSGMLGVWLPGCPVSSDDPAGLDFDLPGHLETDRRETLGPTGRLATYQSTSSYPCFERIRWSHVSRDRALYGVNPAIVSWTKFRRDCLSGGNSTYFPIDENGRAPTVRFYYDADNNLLLGQATGYDGEYQVALPASEALKRAVPGWNGLWTVEIEEMTKT